MVQIQNALNMPGADEKQLAQGILALQKVKNELGEESKTLKTELEKKQAEIADKEKELNDIKAKLEALEKEKATAETAQAEQKAEEILVKAVAEGKIYPAEIDQTSEKGKKNRKAYLDRIKMNAEVFDAMPVINKLGAKPAVVPQGQSKVDVVQEAQILVADMAKSGVKMSYSEAVDKVMRKHNLK
jgi:chromosome segregation ATPase